MLGKDKAIRKLFNSAYQFKMIGNSIEMKHTYAIFSMRQSSAFSNKDKTEVFSRSIVHLSVITIKQKSFPEVYKGILNHVVRGVAFCAILIKIITEFIAGFTLTPFTCKHSISKEKG